MEVHSPSTLRVLCLVPYPTLGASNRLRVEQYAPSLRSLGIEIEVSPFLDEPTYGLLYLPGHTRAKMSGVVRGFARRMADVRRAAGYDLVLIHREATPLGPPWVERALGLSGLRYVFDFDDAIFLPAVHPVNRRWRWLRHPSRAAETVRRAHSVIAGNDYLAAWARSHNRDVTVIPTAVDTDRHRPRADARREGPLVIGWVGSSTTAPYLHLLDDALDELGPRHDLIVRVVGGSYAHARATVEVRPFRLEREPADLATFDIGVLPEPDDPWTRGKGALKALLYMATAVPVVASRVGVNPEVVIDGETGFCVSDVRSWVEALDRLAREADLRRRMGIAGRERVVRLYSVAALTPRLAGVLRRATVAAPR